MKTPEELAVLIQNDDKSRIPELWERMRKLYMAKSFNYYDKHRDLCARCGVELEDIQQQTFFAFLQSIEAYEPECGLTFSAYIDYPFKTEMQTLTGMRTASARNDPLNNCASLDKILETEDGNGDTLGDFVPDPSALDFLELLDAQSVGEMIRAEVRKLPDRERDVIAGYFFDGLTLAQIGERLALSPERVRVLKKRGLVELSRRRVLVELWNEYHHTAQLRKLEAVASRSIPAAWSSSKVYEKKAEPEKPDAMERAILYAAEQRERARKSPEEWTRENQIAAILEYLRGDQVTA